jgi:hypothetical protein
MVERFFMIVEYIRDQEAIIEDQYKPTKLVKRYPAMEIRL